MCIYTFLVGLVTYSKRVITECDCLSVQHVRSHSLKAWTADQPAVVRVDVDACAVDKQKVPAQQSEDITHM